MSGGADVELAPVGGEGVVGSLAVGLGCPAGEEAALDSLEGGRVAVAAGEGCRGPTGSELGAARRLRRSLVLLLCTRWPRWRPSLIIIIIINYSHTSF